VPEFRALTNDQYRELSIEQRMDYLCRLMLHIREN
jgi:hypothetical protein